MSAESHGADKPSLWRAHRPKTLLSGLLKCGTGGGSYSKISRDHYGCIITRTKCTCDNRLVIRRDKLETRILDGLANKLMDPDLFKVFADEFYRELNRLRREAYASLDAGRDEIRQIQRKTAKIVEAISEGVSAKPLAAELDRLEARREELERLLSEQANPPPPIIHPALAEIYRRKVASLRSSLNDPTRAPEAAEIIRSPIEGIEHAGGWRAPDRASWRTGGHPIAL